MQAAADMAASQWQAESAPPQCVELNVPRKRHPMPNKNASIKESLNKQIFEMQSRICKAFANPKRLQILDLLGRHYWAFSDLCKELAISKTNLSQHLAVLKAAGVIVTRREGKNIRCALAMTEVKQACHLIHNVLRRQIKESQKLRA